MLFELNFLELVPAELVLKRPFDRAVIRLSTRFRDSWQLDCFANDVCNFRISLASKQQLGHIGIGDFLRISQLTHLEVVDRSDVGIHTVTDWVAVLSALPLLTHLEVKGADGPNNVIPALAQRPVAQSGTYTMCPALRSMTLGWELLSCSDAVDGGNAPARNLPEACDLATYRDRDVEDHIRRRCSLMQAHFEQRGVRVACRLERLDSMSTSSWERGIWTKGCTGES
ncbi:hypothetical protein BD311DRAFT_657168 [Dichomitus squalens]|uniref:Uncharacterized protein n=1 Tax=Dichomitus squalens TaxID=114155 RepID=A0A4Q9MTL5_9APHY|nr:hypothetical protein BD311DRAFT_657168 [Dichomitus squalens]